MIPNKIKKGDLIGIVAPSNPIIGENIEEINNAKEIVQKDGFLVKFSKNLFENTNQYSNSPIKKAQDINDMFANENIKMIWCAKGGQNSNTTFDYLDFDLIQKNPKIICGYSDITSLTNIIYAKTGLVTFSGTNFKTIATAETNYAYEQAKKIFVEGEKVLGNDEDKYITIKQGTATGILVGGNLSLIRGLVLGKYSLDFTDKILFIEELGLETPPALASNYLYYMKQNGVFNKIKGLWIGNYENEEGISLEKIVLDTIGDEYNFPIIKSNNFGHIEKNTVIPIGVKAQIDTSEKIKIKLLENCIKL